MDCNNCKHLNMTELEQTDKRKDLHPCHFQGSSSPGTAFRRSLASLESGNLCLPHLSRHSPAEIREKPAERIQPAYRHPVTAGRLQKKI